MAVFSERVDIFHGTPRAFGTIVIPDGDFDFDRDGRDEYGRGFYVALDPLDPTKAEQYATSYAGYRGMGGVLLQGKMEKGQYALLNFSEEIGEELAKKFRTQLLAVNTGNEDIDNYYRDISSQISADMKGLNLWNRITNPLAVEGLRKQKIHQSHPPDHWKKTQEAMVVSLKKLLRGADGDVFDSPDTPTLPEENVQKAKGAIKSLQTDDPLVRDYYASVAENIKSGDKVNRIVDALKDASCVAAFEISRLPEIDLQKMASSMDQHATQALNGAGLHGVYIPQQQTAVFKGGMGIQALPDLSIRKIVGAGVSPQNNLTGGDLREGQVLIPSLSNPAPSLPRAASGRNRHAVLKEPDKKLSGNDGKYPNAPSAADSPSVRKPPSLAKLGM